MLAKMLRISFALLLCVGVLPAQEAGASPEGFAVEEVSVSVNPEEEISLESPEVASEVESPGVFSTVWIFVRMVLVLIVVLACVYGVFHLLRRTSGFKSSSDPFLRKVAQLNLSPGKSVQVVTLLDNAYLIGVTDSSISLIAQVSDGELVDSMNLYADRNDRTARPRTFADILELFTARKDGVGGVFGAGGAADGIKRQREQFNGSENSGNGERNV